MKYSLQCLIQWIFYLAFMSNIAKYCDNMKNAAKLLHFYQRHGWNQDLNSGPSEQKTNTLQLCHSCIRYYGNTKYISLTAFIEPQPAWICSASTLHTWNGCPSEMGHCHVIGCVCLCVSVCLWRLTWEHAVFKQKFGFSLEIHQWCLCVYMFVCLSSCSLFLGQLYALTALLFFFTTSLFFLILPLVASYRFC